MHLKLLININCKIYVIENVQTLKYVSLITLTLQNAMVGLSMRYSRTRTGDMFLSSTGNLNQQYNALYVNKIRICYCLFKNIAYLFPFFLFQLL